MEIKRLQENDYPLLSSAIQLLIPEVNRVGSIASNAHLMRALADKNCYFIVCLIDSSPVGYLSAFRFPAIENDVFYVYLYDISVDEKLRNKGLGSRMIAELKKYCKEDGVEHIWVGTSLENEAARKTFENTGAQKVSETYIEYIYRINIEV
ncbi:GNAT family N-acetyltransferase [Chlorogloeopsis sp. ULAP01]|uniref:GNAT family N-acetyltransferase n=1 Tax=Chlorogloeopsis sp. ULAP01 TaxID=3056483 RepID=UPI0025AB0625|nr:GNAT family N-acetyltransferase [Chlorogloeopsis sp. ULAP01]MDM9382357.1 GNAT family N-acetyltransferase [Chlorogloeopsis sp. ULAP01]